MLIRGSFRDQEAIKFNLAQSHIESGTKLVVANIKCIETEIFGFFISISSSIDLPGKPEYSDKLKITE